MEKIIRGCYLHILCAAFASRIIGSKYGGPVLSYDNPVWWAHQPMSSKPFQSIFPSGSRQAWPLLALCAIFFPETDSGVTAGAPLQRYWLFLCFQGAASPLRSPRTACLHQALRHEQDTSSLSLKKFHSSDQRRPGPDFSESGADSPPPHPPPFALSTEQALEEAEEPGAVVALRGLLPEALPLGSARWPRR